ncbi:MAG: hypothetical protein ACI3V4_13005 [Faecousia sp.]
MYGQKGLDMKQNFFIPMYDLQLFADGSDAVTSGDNTHQAETTPVAETPHDRNAEFEKLITGEYKEEYEKRVQDTLQQRFKGSKETADRLAAIMPALEHLAQWYGVNPSDMGALAAAIEDDDSFYMSEALQKGAKVEGIKEMHRIERENQRLRAQVGELERIEKANQQYTLWAQQAEQAKQRFPSLDMNLEAKNPQFMQLLKAGVDVGSAYLAIHKDDILPAAMQHTAQVGDQEPAGNSGANSSRPTDNGANPLPATNQDVSKLTKAERAEIRKRVAMGETIRL